MSSEQENKLKAKERYNRLVKKYLTTKRVLIFVILLIVVLMFAKAFKGILLLLLFFPLAKYSVKITAFVPHVTLEQYTSSTLFMAYLYGPVAGLLSGFVLGFYGYLSNSISKFLALTNVFVAAFIGFFLGLFVQKNILGFASMPFSTVFVIGIVLFNIVAYFVFLFVDPDQIQNAVYRISHLFFNGLISVLFFNVLFILYNLI